MTRSLFHFTLVVLFLSALALAGRFPAHSDSSSHSDGKASKADRSYRSKSSTHKVIVHAHEEELRDSILADGGSVIEEYGGYSLMSAPTETADAISLRSLAGASVRDDMNLIQLRAATFDTTEGEPRALRIPDDVTASGEGLYLVQMIGPVKQEWLDELQSAAEIISYIPNNAYLVRAASGSVDTLRGSKGFIQWAGEYKPAYKVAPELAIDSDREASLTVQLANGQRADQTVQEIASRARNGLVDDVSDVANFRNVRVKIASDRIADLARLGDVLWIEPYEEPGLFDERQGLILANKYAGTQLNPPGYLSWLQSKGLASTPDFLVDVSDTGIDRGVLDPDVLHKDFLNASGLARVAYARLVGNGIIDGPGNDINGHGTINAAIVGGYNTGTIFPSVDNEGYSYGLGIHPFVRMGVTKLFNPTFTSPNFVTMLDDMYRDGTRISSNSWGANTNNYTVECQTYDSLVRDARRTEAGNQEMTVVFAMGNSGHDKLAAPATAKNVIGVGASENLRPSGRDGCGVDVAGADDALSIIDFSSGGLTTDGRVKPELMAPGTHIQGARSQDPGYVGSGVCGPASFPLGQTLYTWSSGTSHAAPAVAGAAALLRQFFQQSTGRAPSPAMVKAFLANSTTYMTGARAGGNLPGTAQGWGLVNLGRSLDDTPRVSVDQTQVLGASGQIFTLKGRVSDPSKPFRITLAWTDAPGSPAANPVVNNLDLQVSVGGKTYLGNRFTGGVSAEGGTSDPRNNLESVWLPAGASGEFEVRVVGTNIAGDGLPGNADATDQDFALVVYNAQSEGSGGGGGGGGGGSIDPPPTVSLTFPKGGEKLIIGNSIRILWAASDNKDLQSQRVEFSSDGGATFNVLAVLDGKARSFDWKVSSVPTPLGRVRITALDGVNLPVSAMSTSNILVENGPPDTSPPAVLLLSPAPNAVVGGGATATITWTENDNVGVIQRVIEFSTDNGATFQKIIELTAPSGGANQSYDWQVPANLDTTRAKVRITVFDGAGNSAAITSVGKFEVWPMPIITGADWEVLEGGKGQLEVMGRFFRMNKTEVWVDGLKLKKIRFDERCDTVNDTCRKVSVDDKKVHKRVPEGKFVNIVVKIPRTGQVSPAFSYKRKKKDSQ
ncbi:MAG TPA: S8 family serine peptidase [Blastocatellia bacterium]|nr:S8 family serine peptidase [Blastocatellia bacterium]